jgi:hypothetical protein
MGLDTLSVLIGAVASPVVLILLKELLKAFRSSVKPDTSSRGLKVLSTTWKMISIPVATIYLDSQFVGVMHLTSFYLPLKF